MGLVRHPKLSRNLIRKVLRFDYLSKILLSVMNTNCKVEATKTKRNQIVRIDKPLV